MEETETQILDGIKFNGMKDLIPCENLYEIIRVMKSINKNNEGISFSKLTLEMKKLKDDYANKKISDQKAISLINRRLSKAIIWLENDARILGITNSKNKMTKQESSTTKDRYVSEESKFDKLDIKNIDFQFKSK